VLAGALLAIEFVRRSAEPAQDRFNYWTVSPWYPFLLGRQRREARRPACPFCGVPELRTTATRLWGTSVGHAQAQGQGGPLS
jgi:hypothetical protein